MNARKDYETRKNEILDAAGCLFARKGFDEVTVNDILNAVGIGKGTFYYYFSSKEEVLKDVVKRVVKDFSAKAREIAENEEMTAQQKFRSIITEQTRSVNVDKWVLGELHKVENAKLHQLSLTEMILAIIPSFTKVVEQGIEEGTFKTPYPEETIEILLIANQFMFDAGIFNWEKEALFQKVEAFVYSVELLLGAETGSLQYIIDQYVMGAQEEGSVSNDAK